MQQQLAGALARIERIEAEKDRRFDALEKERANDRIQALSRGLLEERMQRREMAAELKAAMERLANRADKKLLEERLARREERLVERLERERMQAAIDRATMMQQIQALQAEVAHLKNHHHQQQQGGSSAPSANVELPSRRPITVTEPQKLARETHQQEREQLSRASTPTTASAAIPSETTWTAAATQKLLLPQAESSKPAPQQPPSQPQEQHQPSTTNKVVVPVPDGFLFHCFISHSQGTGGDQANAIYLELERMGFKCWYDNRADDLTKEGMLKGIEESAAFVVFLSTGILERPYCQLEIRHALALKKPVVLLHESDARYGSFDFRAAHAAAPVDLQELLDQHESLPFRRRGYERDGMLKTVVARMGFKDLWESSQAGTGSQAEALAAVPSELNPFALEALFERPVQAELVELLLLPKDDSRFTSCVLIHGMGGTGKTVTAVAAVQDRAVRVRFSNIFWLTVGADAIGERVKQLQALLYKQISGKGTKTEEKGEQDWQQMLVEALADKQRALVVLDDPWMPEQVRFLNPIDGSLSEHRLLVTTRIRDLVPKATRLELPLMGKDEAVALLLDLAGVEEAEYLKENPTSAWPPAAAYTIAAECGLLPITLTIAAQVVRSWGEGWELSVLPLLREQEGSGQSRTTTAEERVIGAGLKALEKTSEGPAVKGLFHMFAVTQEDFVHPMAVIEMLWRSCCASESEKEEGSLMTRLKVRQWTQMLVDHSLLLGSSSEGVHLHDIVLQYLRKRLSPEQMRADQRKVVDGFIAVSQMRMATNGRGLIDTGSTAKAYSGEEVDWYCCNIGSFHVREAVDPAVALADSADVRRWLLNADDVVVRAAAVAVGAKALQHLGAHFREQEDWFCAVKIEVACAGLSDSFAVTDHYETALALIAEHSLVSSEAQQTELNILMLLAYIVRGAKRAKFNARAEELLADNGDLRADPLGLAFVRDFPRAIVAMGVGPESWDADCCVTEESILVGICIWFGEFLQAHRQAAAETVGARGEVYHFADLTAYTLVSYAGSERAAAVVREFLRQRWGEDGSQLIECRYSYDRHFEPFRGFGARVDCMLEFWYPYLMLESYGDAPKAIKLFTQQLAAWYSFIREAPPSGGELPNFWLVNTGAWLSLEVNALHAFGPALVKLLAAFGCKDTIEIVTWYQESADWVAARGKRSKSSADGQHHAYPPDAIKASLQAQLSLASAGTDHSVNLGWLDTLPNASSSTLYDCGRGQFQAVCARALVAEVLMKDGRIDDAIGWSQAALEDEFNFNFYSRVRCGNLLARCHATRGEHSLSIAAADAALELARIGQLLWQEASIVHGRALAGQGAKGAGEHWDEVTGKQRLAEVLGRVVASRADGRERGAELAVLEAALPVP